MIGPRSSMEEPPAHNRKVACSNHAEGIVPVTFLHSLIRRIVKLLKIK